MRPLIWTLTDDRPGNATQTLGVAEALNRPFVIKPIRYGALARLPSLVQGASRMGLAAESRDQLAPPWPDIVIAAGRRTGPIARWIKRAADKPVILAQLMSPGRSGADDFDLIAVPNHDCRLPGGDAANVLRITGAPHRLSPARLRQEAAAWTGKLNGIPRPFIAVLVGGATRKRPFPDELARTLGEGVSRMASEVRGSVLLTTSRRTGSEAEAILARTLAEPRSLFLWSEGKGDNPYLGFLALADAVVVTGDSVSMCSEACATGAPVFIFSPPGFAAPKHERLHRELYERGLARTFDGRFDQWEHPPLNAAGEIAAALERIAARRFPSMQ